jgi:hypothetical protein
MTKLTLSTAAFLIAASTSALAESKVWNVTEESPQGLKSGQGQWLLTVDGNRLSGNANMLYDNGNPLSYTVEGTVNDSVYTVTMNNRTDRKMGCVWSGHVPEGADMKSHGLIGKVECEGKVGFTIRAGF